LYPTQQEETKLELGLGFSMQEIVNFIQSQTNNFTVSFYLAEEIDANIYSIYEKYIKEKKEDIIKIEPKVKLEIEPEVEVVGNIDDDIKDFVVTIDGLLDLLKEKEIYEKEDVEDWIITIDGLIELLEEYNFDKKRLSTFKKQFAKFK